MPTDTPYTPGPYHIRRVQRARDALVEIRGSTEISPMGPLVAVVKSALKRTEADAALFSAAPDMARELAHLVRLLEPLEKDGGLDVPGLATLNGARAALRKAGVLP